MIPILAALKSLELIQRTRPVRSQQSRQASISKNFSTGLAASTIVGFVVRVANPLNLFATPRAQFPIASVNRHPLAKCSHFFRKASLRFCSEPIYPELESVASGCEQPFPFILF